MIENQILGKGQKMSLIDQLKNSLSRVVNESKDDMGKLNAEALQESDLVGQLEHRLQSQIKNELKQLKK